MSELINNSNSRKELLKHMILQLHDGVAPEAVNERLVSLLTKIPYGEVVEVEQELISEGLPQEEVLKLCDVHTRALNKAIDLTGMKIVAPGHPVDTFRQENRALEKEVQKIEDLYKNVDSQLAEKGNEKFVNELKQRFNNLIDVDKHYRRKENLLFPFLEKYGITGPPTVMWGKHDETRNLLKNAFAALEVFPTSINEIQQAIESSLRPASTAITDMIMKEDEILLPMTMDKLTEVDWYQIYQQTNEIGYCLYDPQITWKPEGVDFKEIEAKKDEDGISLPSGKFATEELLAILNTVPFDLTFVDRNDKVKYFSQGKERIFDRNRAILGRDVRMCHPPGSVHIVDQIISDFKNGVADSAPFWINLNGKFIHIEYFVLRNEKGEYLGTLEVSQDLTEKRSLTGDQRLLSYREKTEKQPKEEEHKMNGPKWFEKSKIKVSLDARPLLAQGIHPLERVLKETSAMLPGEIYEIITPFPPSPMIEKLSDLGFETYSENVEGMFHTYFCK